jgi:hypothetical protein
VGAGVLLGVAYVGSLEALWGTTYGKTLLIKSRCSLLPRRWARITEISHAAARFRARRFRLRGSAAVELTLRPSCSAPPRSSLLCRPQTMTSATAFRSVALLLALLACDQKPQTSTIRARGPSLGQAIPKPDFTLTATDGSQFNFRQQTEGKIALFFGYTHCPDVCPVHSRTSPRHSIPSIRGPAEGGSRIRHHRSRP